MISAETRALVEGTSRITLTASPYTSVRTIVMESKLLGKQEYDKLLKMSLAEIIQFLEEATYKQEIDELAVSEDGVQLVEHAANRNFRRAVEKLRRISDENLRFLIDVYLWRNDIQNIKTIIRAKQGMIPTARVQNMFTPGSIAKTELLELYARATVEDVIRAIDMPFMKNALETYRAHGMTTLESAMTKQYYETTVAIARRIKGDGAALRNFLLLEIDCVNILTVLKLKHEGASDEQLRTYLIHNESSLSDADVREATRRRFREKMIAAKDVSACFALLKQTRFGEALEHAAEAYEKTQSLLDAEKDLQIYLLRRATLLTHQNPLSVDVVLGYLFEKVNETRNIFMLIKGKQLGVPETFLEQELVIR